MHAPSRLGQPGPFEVEADQARNAIPHAVLDRLKRRDDPGAFIGDQRCHQARHAELAVRRGHRAESCDCRRIVEQHATAAIHLHIDKPRRQHPIQQLSAGDNAQRYGGDAAVGDLNRAAFKHLGTGEYARGRQHRHVSASP